MRAVPLEEGYVRGAVCGGLTRGEPDVAKKGASRGLTPGAAINSLWGGGKRLGGPYSAIDGHSG